MESTTDLLTMLLDRLGRIEDRLVCPDNTPLFHTITASSLEGSFDEEVLKRKAARILNWQKDSRHGSIHFEATLPMIATLKTNGFRVYCTRLPSVHPTLPVDIQVIRVAWGPEAKDIEPMDQYAYVRL